MTTNNSSSDPQSGSSSTQTANSQPEAGKQETPRFWREMLILSTSVALTAVLTFAGTSFTNERNSIAAALQTKTDYLREEKVSAYSDYISTLLNSEDAQQQGILTLRGTSISSDNVDQASTRVLINSTDDIQNAKSLVDLLGSSDVKAAGVASIDAYGRLAGDIQDAVTKSEAGTRLDEQQIDAFQQRLDAIDDECRVRFNELASRDVGVSIETTAVDMTGCQNLAG